MAIDQVQCPECKGTGQGEGKTARRVGKFAGTFQNDCPLCHGAKSISTDQAEQITRGEELKHQREFAGLSIEQYAYRRGIEPSLWRAYENAHIENRHIRFE